MVSLMSLWLPILLAAVAVFIVSSIIHMALRYHNTDFQRLPAEDDVMRALGAHNIAPGEYLFPYPHGGAGSMKDPAYIEKRTRGPVGILNAHPAGMPGLGGQLAKWFVYSVVVSLFAAYLASRALSADAPGGEVFRFTATVGFIAYGLGHVADSIWWGRAWSVTFKNLFDALLYGSATGAVFVFLWP